MGKEKGCALSRIKVREMRHFLERQGYNVEPGQHKHLRLEHGELSDVRLPLRPGDDLTYIAINQIAGALKVTSEEITHLVASGVRRLPTPRVRLDRSNLKRDRRVNWVSA